MRIGDSAVEPLLAALKDGKPRAQWAAAWALMLNATPQADDAVSNFLRDRNLTGAAQDYVSIIKPGNDDDVLPLMFALEQHGRAEMADDFADCGNSALANAANRWARHHEHRLRAGSEGSPNGGSRDSVRRVVSSRGLLRLDFPVDAEIPGVYGPCSRG